MSYLHFFIFVLDVSVGGRRGRDRMVVGFKITYAISAYQLNNC
jgi:hypothetical protein